MALREILASFGFTIDDSGLKKANAGVDSVVSKLTNLKGAIAGGLAALGLGALKGQIDDLASESGELNKAAIKAGVGFEQFQKLQYTTGLSTEQLTTTFRNLQLGMASAKGAAGDTGESFADLAAGGLDKIGKQKAGDALKNLKVDLVGAGGVARSSSDVFQDTITKLAAIQDPSKRAAAAVQVFGRAGQDLLPLLQKSPEALKAAADQFDAIGGISEEARQKLASYGKEQKALNLASNALKIAILTAVVPAFTWLFSKINEGITWFTKYVDTSQLITAGLAIATASVVAFGAANAAAAASAFLGWIKVAAPIAILFLLVDDLIHFFKGDAKTATEAFINTLFGIDEGNAIISDIRVGFQNWLIDIHNAQGALETIKALLGGIVDAIKFVTSPAKWSHGSGFEQATDAVTDQQSLDTIRRGGSAGSLLDRAGTEIRDLFTGSKGGVKPDQAFLEGRNPISIPVPGAAGGAPANNTVTQNTTINQTINGADAKDAADQAVDGIKKVRDQDRRGVLAAVEARK